MKLSAATFALVCALASAKNLEEVPPAYLGEFFRRAAPLRSIAGHLARLLRHRHQRPSRRAHRVRPVRQHGAQDGGELPQAVYWGGRHR
eukprot:scaffold434_cov186-Pinguiococcus_pyrenoidosus.AAC.145